jgi:transposase
MRAARDGAVSNANASCRVATDTEERVWRHLNTCQFGTYVHARVPRVDCPEHGVVQVNVPCAMARSRFDAPKVMAVKRRACGYWNPEHFKTTIYFFRGGLDLYPRETRKNVK